MMAGLLRITVPILLVLASLTACNKSWSPGERSHVDRSGYEMTQDGFYRVRRGDSLHAIAFNLGLDFWPGDRNQHMPRSRSHRRRRRSRSSRSRRQHRHSRNRSGDRR
mgnify:CR=1 FL=1